MRFLIDERVCLHVVDALTHINSFQKGRAADESEETDRWGNSVALARTANLRRKLLSGIGLVRDTASRLLDHLSDVCRVIWKSSKSGSY